MPERVAIVGIGETDAKAKRNEVSQTELVNEAVRAALEDAELTINDIDVVIEGNMELFEGNYLVDMWLTEGLGSYLKSGMKVNSAGSTGGTVFTTGVSHAASGLFNTVLIVGYEKQDEGAWGAVGLRAEDSLFDVSGGTGGAMLSMWATAKRLLRQKSVAEEHAAQVRVKSAECALRNPHAHLRRSLTVEEVMNSRPLILPLRLLHMCPTSVVACAIIVAPEAKAKKITRKPVWVEDHVTVHGGLTPRSGALWMSVQLEDPFGPQWHWSAGQATAKLYKRNGITNPRKEIDLFEIYDPSTWQELDFYETAGICEEGNAWRLVEERATWPNGDVPFNPSGGVISTNAIGASGLLRVAEAAIQIRGDGGERQVVKPVNRAFASALGGDRNYIAVLLNKSL